MSTAFGSPMCGLAVLERLARLYRGTGREADALTYEEERSS